MAGGDSNDCLRVVRTRAGQGTGETLYETSDGRWWRKTERWEADGSCTMPNEIRWHHGPYLCRHR